MSKLSPTRPGCVSSAIGAAVPVRLLKRDLFFVLEKLVSLLDESRIEMLARQHGIRQKRDEGGIAKTLIAFLRRADEGTLSRLMVEATILLAASRHNGTSVLKDAATVAQGRHRGHRPEGEAGVCWRRPKRRWNLRPAAKPVPKSKKAAQRHILEGRRTCRLSFFCLKSRRKSTASVSSCDHLLALRSGPRSPAARQDDVPPSCTFPFYCLRRSCDVDGDVVGTDNKRMSKRRILVDYQAMRRV